jgi:predicted RNase H-like HicB family nuclease
MRKFTYLAVFERDEKPGFSVYFPDVPGCISCGDDFEHTLQMAQEALGLHIYGLEKDGEALPLKTDEVPELDRRDMVVPISIYPDLVKAELDNRRVKTTITLPLWLKTVAEREGINYSRLLETTLKDTLHIAG